MHGEVEENELIDGFLKYLIASERQIIDVALKSDSNVVFSPEELLDILEEFKCRLLVNRTNISEVVQKLAKQELYQKPHLMASCWSSVFPSLRVKLPGSESLRKLYQVLKPTYKKLVAIIHSKPEHETERECLHYFKKYVNSLDKPMLKYLLVFLTGSQFLTVDDINVSFTENDSTFARRPIADTCGPCLELRLTYSNFCELIQECTYILKKSTWEMDIV